MDTSQHTYLTELDALGLHHLTSQEEHYVLFRIRGINPSAAARQAGYSFPVKTVAELSERKDIQQAIAYGREIARQAAINAGALEFTKDDATALYLEAHAKAATATEEIKAVDSLVKLHGLATPEKLEIEITHREQLKELDDDKLMEISGEIVQLDPSDYTEVEDDE